MKILCFLAIGLFSALVDYSVRSFLLNLGALGILARAASYVVGSTVAYYLNSFLTFNGARSRQEKIRAAVVYTLCFCVAVLVDFLARVLGVSGEHVLVVSWVSSQAVATVLNFILQNFYVFRPETSRK